MNKAPLSDQLSSRRSKWIRGKNYGVFLTADGLRTSRTDTALFDSLMVEGELAGVYNRDAPVADMVADYMSCGT